MSCDHPDMRPVRAYRRAGKRSAIAVAADHQAALHRTIRSQADRIEQQVAIIAGLRRELAARFRKPTEKQS